MKKRLSDKPWFPFWVDKWIFGSMRIECTLEERAIWIDLLALASKDDGYIRANETTPYLIQQLSGMLVIPEDKLIKAINKFVELKKLEESTKGIYQVVMWEKYQLSKRHKERFEEPENDIPSENDDTMSEKGDTLSNQIKLEQIKSEQIIEYTEEEKQILKELKEIKNFPRNKEKIINYFRKLKGEFPKVDALRVAQEFYPYSLKKPLTKNSNPFSQIRRFFINQIKFDKERDKELTVGGSQEKVKLMAEFQRIWDEQIGAYLEKEGKSQEEMGKIYWKAKKAYPIIKTTWEQSDKKPATFVRLVEKA